MSRKQTFAALLLACTATLLAPLRIGAQAEPESKPVLRIETGMHTAAIRRIATDAAGRWLATASDDKTVRIWEVESGRLVQTLRVPVGVGFEGKIYAVALSPSGNTVAAAGYTSPNGLDTNIYLVDRLSGQMRSRIAVLPNVVFHLAFSPDGTRLAAALGANGVRVFQMPEGTLLWQDTKYEDRSDGAAFDRQGRLATACEDGSIRLYDAAGSLLVPGRADARSRLLRRSPCPRPLRRDTGDALPAGHPRYPGREPGSLKRRLVGGRADAVRCGKVPR
jgi:WD40 repeat protein